MTIMPKLNSGLVFGLEQQEMAVEFNDEPGEIYMVNAIMLHLSIFSIAFIFN